MPAYILRNVACDITSARAACIKRARPASGERYSAAFFHSAGHAHASGRYARKSRISVARRAPPSGRVHSVLLDPAEHNDLNDTANRVAA